MPGTVPSAGALEELDGTPIRPPAAGRRPPAVAWPRAAVAAAAVVAGRPRLWTYALVAFLARGGLLVLALPIAVLPTFIGVANVLGPASVSAAGPSPRLLALIVAAIAAVAVLVLVGTVVAAAAETALHRATVAPDPEDVPGPAAPPGESFLVLAPSGGPRRAVARVVALRLLLLVPVAIVTALAVPAWIAVAYRELTLPSDVAAPLPVRVLAGAPAASVAVLVAWLVAETVGGFATRRAVLLGASVPRALGRGIADPLRAPVGTALTVLVALALTVLAVVPGAWAVSAAWDAARDVLTGDAGAAAVLAVALGLAAAWLTALVLAGIAAAARAVLMTAELLRRDGALGAQRGAPRA